MVNFFINPSKNVLLCSLANARNEATQKSLNKSLDNSDLQSIRLHTVEEIVGVESNVISKLV